MAGQSHTAGLCASDYPRSGEFWAVSPEDEAVRLQYWPGGSAWAGSPLYMLLDEDGSAYAEADLFGWDRDPDVVRAAISKATGEGS